MDARYVHAGGGRRHARHRDQSHRPHLPARRQRASRGDRIGSRRRVRHGAVSADVEHDRRPVEAAGSCSSSAAIASRTSSRSLTAISSGSCSRLELDRRVMPFTSATPRPIRDRFRWPAASAELPSISTAPPATEYERYGRPVDAAEVPHYRRHLRIVHVEMFGNRWCSIWYSRPEQRKRPTSLVLKLIVVAVWRRR